MPPFRAFFRTVSRRLAGALWLAALLGLMPAAPLPLPPAGATGPQPRSASDADPLLEAARARVRQRDGDGALELYRQAAAATPDSVTAHLELGTLCGALRQPDCMLEAFRSVMRLRPDDVGLMYDIARVLRRSAQTHLALNAYARILELEPEHADAAFERAQALHDAGQPEQALAAFTDFARRFTEDGRRDQARKRVRALRAVQAREAGHFEVPVLHTGSVLLVDGAVQGVEDETEVRFLLDTGATTTVISRRLAARLGIGLRSRGMRTARFQTANGPVFAPIVTLESVRVGNAVAYDVEAAVHDLGGVPIEAILGLSFLGQFRFTIDADEELLILEPR
jgi:clan AA aspartic protease (TIGR02281 family)